MRKRLECLAGHFIQVADETSILYKKAVEQTANPKKEPQLAISDCPRCKEDKQEKEKREKSQ